MHETLHLARELSHPASLTLALFFHGWLQLEHGNGHGAQEQADAMVALASEHGIPTYVAWGTGLRGGVLIARERKEEGIAQIHQGLEAYAGGLIRTLCLTWLAVGYEKAGRVEEGLATIAEALRLVDKNDERICEAELYRIKGELLLAQAREQATGNGEQSKNRSQ